MQDVIISNIPGALGVERRCQVDRVNTTVKPGIHDIYSLNVKNTENNLVSSEADNELNDDTSRQSVVTNEINITETCAAVQTRSECIKSEAKTT